MSSEDKQYGKQTARQTDSIDNGDPRQCSGGKLKMVMKMKSYEYHAPFASPRQVGKSGSSQRGKWQVMFRPKRGNSLKMQKVRPEIADNLHTHTAHHE